MKNRADFRSSCLQIMKVRLWFSFATFVLLFLCVITTCNAKNCHITSSCGHIPNISFPFRLKTDPIICGDRNYELACENNQTVLYLDSIGFYVQSINYENYTIRIVDTGIENNQCSFPLHSSNLDAYFTLPRKEVAPIGIAMNNAVTFISCPSKIESSLYVDTHASCNTKDTSLASMQEYSYVLIGDNLTVADVQYLCTINMMAWYSSEFSITDNLSYSTINDALVDGFSLTWNSVYCQEYCVYFAPVYCFFHKKNTVTCIPVYYDKQEALWLLAIKSIAAQIAIALLARFFWGLPCLFVLVAYKCRRRHLSTDETIEEFLQGQINLLPMRYKYSDIKNMTNNFKNKLGEGGYGSVYKGKLKSGIFVAVKLMNKSKASGQEFINEVATIGMIHHGNVVHLIGFCVEGSKRALVYEFMPNGSLEKYIFLQEETNISLSYEKMFKISLGVAKGIDYLHRGCEMQILHFDIKPHNILLDEYFNPKVSDFGLAKLYSADDSIVSLTTARGTMGYMAPELFYKNIGGVSYKADVYSYGMLLMEMAGRRKNLNPFAENISQIYFPSWAYDQFNEGKEIRTGYNSEEERKLVKKMILIGLWCIQMNPAHRPSMDNIVEMLEEDDQHLKFPPKPVLCPEE